MPAISYLPRYTIADYLRWEGDWELWDGIPVSMAPCPKLPHQRTSRAIFRQVDEPLQREPCDHGCEAFYETEWHANEHTVVCPDLLVVCPAPEGDWITEAPDLIAEILSESTRDKDLVQKRELYAVEGVAFYLIADPEGARATLLRLDGEGTYREIPAGEPFDLQPGCTVAFDPTAFFPSPSSA